MKPIDTSAHEDRAKGEDPRVGGGGGEDASLTILVAVNTFTNTIDSIVLTKTKHN